MLTASYAISGAKETFYTEGVSEKFCFVALT